MKLLQLKCSNSQTITQLSAEEINQYLTQVNGWQKTDNELSIFCEYKFKNFKQTMFFINALAFLCEKECHHPEVKFGYNYCTVTFSTHDINGISLNDFICAAKTNNLVE